MQKNKLEKYLKKYQRRVELRESLLATLRDNVDVIFEVPGAMLDCTDGYGFRSTHINKLLQLVRMKGDPNIADEQLKLELLREMLGGYPVYKTAMGGTTYFVSSYEAWCKTLGKALKVVPGTMRAAS
jgi:hypothetical protein